MTRTGQMLRAYDYEPTAKGWWHYHRDLVANEGHALWLRWFWHDRLMVGLYLDLTNPRLSFEVDRRGIGVAVWPLAFAFGATS